jgi:hypothetical protein
MDVYDQQVLENQRAIMMALMVLVSQCNHAQVDYIMKLLAEKQDQTKVIIAVVV